LSVLGDIDLFLLDISVATDVQTPFFF